MRCNFMHLLFSTVVCDTFKGPKIDEANDKISTI